MPTGLDEIDKILKGGRPIEDRPKEPTVSVAPSSEPSAAPDTGAHDTFLDRANRIGDQLDTGILKTFAGAATGIPRAINAGIGLVAPSFSAKLGDLAEQIPGVKRAEAFAAEPSASTAETIGSVGGGAALLGGPGSLGWGARFAGAPTFAGGARGFVSGTARPGLQRVAETAEAATKGAAAGAATDPDAPGTGAVIGGVTGGLLPLAGQALQSKPGQYLAGQGARASSAAAVTALSAALGVPTHWLWAVGIPELLRFYHSPVGKKLDAAGRRAAAAAGRGLEHFDPRVPGAATGSLGSVASQAIAEEREAQ